MNSEVQVYSRLKNNLSTMKLNEFAAHLDEYMDVIRSGQKTFSLIHPNGYLYQNRYSYPFG